MKINDRNGLLFFKIITVIVCCGMSIGMRAEEVAVKAKRLLLVPKKTKIAISRGKTLRLKDANNPVALAPLIPQNNSSEEKFSFALAYQDFGDMDVPGRQLLEGSLFCEEKVFQLMEDKKNKPTFIGNFTSQEKDNLTDFKKFTRDTHVILGGMGTNFLLKIFSDADLAKKMFLFPIEGAASVQLKKTKNTIFYRPTYKQELIALVDYVLDVQKKERIAIFYESGAWGNALYEDLEKILTKRGVKHVIAARYQQNTVEIARALKNISESTPDVVFFLSKPRPTYYFIKQAMELGMYKPLFVGISPLISIQYLLKESRGVDIVTTSVVPRASSNIELVSEYKKIFTEKLRTLKHSNYFYFEAFLYVQLLKQALQDVPDIYHRPDLLIKYFESFKEKNFLGIPLSFDPVTRSLITKIWIATGSDNEWIEVKLNKDV